MEVFFYEAFEEEADALRKYCPPGLKIGITGETIQESGHRRPPAPIICIRTQSHIPDSWAAELKAILSRSTGCDHLQAFLKRSGGRPDCGYLPHYCSRAVAEQAMLLWMALLRKLPLQVRQFGAFKRDGLTGRECAGRVLLVAGVGRIGSQIVSIAEGLQMTVLGVDIVKTNPAVNYVSIEEGLPRADIITCAMNLNSGNAGYFNFERFKQCKRGAVFVNVARGELSPLPDLLQALQAGNLGAAALDVYPEEGTLAAALRSGAKSKAPEISIIEELARMPNVILTPHNAFNTHEATERKVVQSYEQIHHYMNTGWFLWRVE